MSNRMSVSRIYKYVQLSTCMLGSIGHTGTQNGCEWSWRKIAPGVLYHNGGMQLFNDLRSVRNFTSQRTNRLADLINLWTRRLSEEGIPEPSESVNLITAHALGKKMIHEVDTYLVPTEETVNAIDEMCQLRLERKPVQYIIKEWDFIDLTLEMCPPVLIPRPETEELALMVVDDLIAKGADQGSFLEIGCGTGAISLYILKRLPKIMCMAVDISKVACDLTMRNASRYDVQDRISVIHADAFQDTTTTRLLHSGQFDVIVSNPPYLRSHEMLQLEPEVNWFEDHTALNAGDDGLDVVRKILHFSRRLLKSEGSVWLEVGLNQTSLIETMVKQTPDLHLVYDQTLQDFSNRDRFCKLSYHRNITRHI